MPLNTTEEIIADLSAGKPIILMDDEDRENEGDLVVLAEHITPEAINFMVKHARGLVCLTITKERAAQLGLRPQTECNTAAYSTAFTVSIEAAQGVTTGISTQDRAHTILAAVAKNASPKDIVQPGHIFPITAQDGGVLVRAGHTEASTDLARLAGYEPAGVICEILKEDGTMARRPDLEAFAQKHHLKIGTIADLIAYRLSREKTIIQLSTCELPTKYGTFTLTAYQSIIDKSIHYALVKGKIQSEKPTFVRVHVQNTLSDLFSAELSERHYRLDDALARLSNEKEGIIVILDDGQTTTDILNRMYAFAHNTPLPKRKQEQDLRTYGIGAQILLDQGVRKMRLLSAPYKFTGLSGYQLEVLEFLNSNKES
ncbi:bifunctional 3,4-dihydroxy-2-butanone-4-phosphate synthase/GTP cyclohydrolase II [Suttonella ornithocola]|uniref:3,4-dihydroxy-2-butanone 4-phosphate synthase n=1 Tax=Suttonella ornithocola TaxID=279832 RepID=A0A380MZP8_9GAMM|nr:bifunctional 3,4-dihydroxy-2-butanone-4-phosphate synthase/GTP cyclohydrolase II [Suttonella ornithocola]SUO97161.1 Riboflavin biosynthesis protein ribBA [Suttonella ornithocola]